MILSVLSPLNPTGAKENDGNRVQVSRSIGFVYHAHLLGDFTSLPPARQPSDGEVQAGETCGVSQGETGSQANLPQGSVTLLTYLHYQN